MSFVSRAKEGGAVLGGLAIMGGMLVLGLALLMGMASFSVWVLKWTYPAFLITLSLTIILLLPLALIPPTRGFAAVGLLIASMAFGAILWLWGMAYTYGAWGLVGVVIGLVFLGVGVVPIAMLAALLHGDWGNLGLFVVTVVVTYGVRALSHWLAGKADERRARLNPSGAVIHQ